MKSHLTLQKILGFRSWIMQNLPLNNSLVAFDIFLFFSERLLQSKTVTVKDLFESLPYSYTAVRYHYKRLLSEGWIEQTNDSKDLRVKYVGATDKMKTLIYDLLDKFDKDFDV